MMHFAILDRKLYSYSEGRSSYFITRGITAALSRQNPGMSEADSVINHTFVGCLELLSDFAISMSTESTSVSSHPVHNYDLEKPQTVQGLLYFPYGD